MSQAGPSDLSDSDDVYSGWVHVVAHGETYDVTFDVRICHSAQLREVEVELGERATGEYVLAFSTNGGTHSKSNCDFGTRIKGGSSVPKDFELLRVTSNGGTIREVVKDGTFPILRPLPDPIDAR